MTGDFKMAEVLGRRFTSVFFFYLNCSIIKEKRELIQREKSWIRGTLGNCSSEKGKKKLLSTLRRYTIQKKCKLSVSTKFNTTKIKLR